MALRGLNPHVSADASLGNRASAFVAVHWFGGEVRS
jgi:hypothetical protein